jgi:hypothetical protein
VIAALYVQTNGCYFGLPDVDPWDEARDARKYAGPWPVVAHPPCQLWVNLAHVNFKRYGGERNRPGNDGGCFASALAAVRKFGGVLEHPAFSNAWAAHGLLRPNIVGDWSASLSRSEWTCEVWQSAYGHKARKRTWLLYVGDASPPPMHWQRDPGTHQIGYHDQRGKSRNKPTVTKREANATPPSFRDALLRLAHHARERRAA